MLHNVLKNIKFLLKVEMTNLLKFHYHFNKFQLPCCKISTHEDHGPHFSLNGTKNIDGPAKR